MKIIRIILSSATLNRCWDAHSHLANYTWSTQTPLVGQNIGGREGRGCKILTRASRWRVLQGHNGSIGGESQKSRSSSIYYIAPPPSLDPYWTILCTYNTCTTYSFPVFIQRQRTQCRDMLGKVYCTPSPPSSSPLSASRWPCWNIIESPPPYITVYVTQADICCL